MHISVGHARSDRVIAALHVLKPQLQVREKSLAEALLASRSSAAQNTAVTIPWGPAMEDILLGACNVDASMTDEDTADLSAKV